MSKNSKNPHSKKTISKKVKSNSAVKNSPQRTFPPTQSLQTFFKSKSNYFWIYGHHAVNAALENTDRQIAYFITSDPAIAQKYQSILDERNIKATLVDKKDLDHILGSDTAHQNVAVYCAPITQIDLQNLSTCQDLNQIVLILDQVTDPQNMGAIIRTAAVFGVKALIIPDRGSPEESGLIAKTACGALEIVPIIRVTNLARTMQDLKDIGFWCVGLSESADRPLHSLDLKGKIAIAMGAEGTGLRRLTQENCDLHALLPSASKDFSTLNVSVATGITLYEIFKKHEF